VGSLMGRVQGAKGFTLVELLVVILIIGILVGIGIPAFLHQRQKAEDSIAVSLVREAVAEMESAYIDSQTYSVGPAALNAIEPTIHWNPASGHVVDAAAPSVTATATAESETVDYYGDATTYSIATLSSSGHSFGVYADKTATGGVTYVKLTDSEASTGW
jgi:type IV pilus assembly protein PilA